MKNASERQSDLIVVTQECDTIVVNLSPEGASNLRNQVTDLKARVTHLTDAVRSQINAVSDAIMQRYYFFHPSFNPVLLIIFFTMSFFFFNFFTKHLYISWYPLPRRLLIIGLTLSKWNDRNAA